MTIMLGTDFTEGARRAGDAAAALAKRFGDTLLVVHAAGLASVPDLPPELAESLLVRARKNLEAEARRLRRRAGTVRTVLSTKAPDRALVAHAAASGTRMVVVSSVGRRALQRWLLGSVAERVAATSPIPVLVVRGDALRRWSARRPLRVLCAYDFSPPAEAALEYVKELREIGPCDVVIGRADSPVHEQLRLGFPAPVPLDRNLPEVQTILERELTQTLTAVLGAKHGRVRVRPTLGVPGPQLLEIASAERVDLIVTGTHQWRGLQRLWHGSTSCAVLRCAPISVLVVPLPKRAKAARVAGTRRHRPVLAVGP